MKIRFFIYGILGWCTEIVWTGLASFLRGDLTLIGWSSIWMFPIYGMLVFLEIIHDRIRNIPLFLRGGIYAALIFSGEFITGMLLKITLGQCPWNYGIDKYSFYGIITLKYLPVWFIFGLLFEKIHDILLSLRIGNIESYKK